MNHLSYLQSTEALALTSTEYCAVILDYIISDVDHPTHAATKIGDLILPGRKEVAFDLLQNQKDTLFGDTLLLVCMHHCASKSDEAFLLKIVELLIRMEYWAGYYMVFPTADKSHPDVCEALMHVSQVINRSDYSDYYSMLKNGTHREPYELERKNDEAPPFITFSLPMFGDTVLPPPPDFHKF
jgi:hypothetical protein